MTEPNPPRTDVAPAALRAVRVILYVQGGATLLALVGTALEVKSRLDHGQEVYGITYVLGLVSIACAVLAVLCAASIVARRRYWVRPAAMGLEVVTIIYGVINIVSGAPAGIGEIVIGILVIVLLARREVSDWIAPDVGAPPYGAGCE